MVKFRIGYRDKEYLSFEVRVFDTAEQLRAHFRRAPTLGKFYGEVLEEKVVGMCCPRRIINVDHGKVTAGQRLGVILLAKSHLAPYYVSHEVAHASLEYYRSTGRTKRSRSADFGPSATPSEERLAYIHGGLFRSMTNKLHEKRLWS